MTPSLDRIEGILLGTAVGDALGLPMKCLKPATIEQLGWNKEWKHRFVLGRGMWSDDTEHTIMLAQSLLASDGNLNTFRKKFAWELRWWLLGFPSGVGMATARALLKLWLGFSPEKSGVFSAGNGACMRTAIIAAYFTNNNEKRISFAQTQTQITHSDQKATIATVALTEVAALLLHSNSSPSDSDILEQLSNQRLPHCDDWNHITSCLKHSIAQRDPLSTFLTEIGIDTTRGISGYAYHTVPAVLYSGMLHDWQIGEVVPEIIAAGGDTDSTAAIAGALCGAMHGAQSIPNHWIENIAEWPSNIGSLRVLAKAIQTNTALRIRARWSPLLLLRNLVFFLIVLKHGFTRLLPGKLRAMFG